MIRSSVAVIVMTTLALAMGSSGAVRADFVQNGDFSQVTNGPNGFFGPNGSSEPVDWSHNNAPMAIFSPGAADATGALTLNGHRNYLWGPNNPAPGPNSLNGLPATSPAGGNFLASDAEPYGPDKGLLSQTISGLTAGQQYTLSFYYALAQFRSEDGSGFNGASFGSWQVSLGRRLKARPSCISTATASAAG